MFLCLWLYSTYMYVLCIYVCVSNYMPWGLKFKPYSCFGFSWEMYLKKIWHHNEVILRGFPKVKVDHQLAMLGVCESLLGVPKFNMFSIGSRDHQWTIINLCLNRCWIKRVKTLPQITICQLTGLDTTPAKGHKTAPRALHLCPWSWGLRMLQDTHGFHMV